MLLNPDNLKRLSSALSELRAKQIYVPPLKEEFLSKGHACHFRAEIPEAKGIRIDVLAKMRGCEPFDILWRRRKKINFKGNFTINVIGLSDLVQSKKTQRDKDWLMLKRLMEIDILTTKKPSLGKVKWWLKECRTHELLLQLSKRYPHIIQQCSKERPLLRYAVLKDNNRLLSSLLEEEDMERLKDRSYWTPLRKELEQLRRAIR